MDFVAQLSGTAIPLQLEEGDAGGYGLRATRRTRRHPARAKQMICMGMRRVGVHRSVTQLTESIPNNVSNT